MAWFRKKPVMVEAIMFNPLEYPKDILEWGTEERPIKFNPFMREIVITTLEGVMIAQEGDWIIRGVDGEVYPCKAYIFERTYERVVG